MTMILSRDTLKNITGDSVQKPSESLFELPEKVLQFGTGVLLRGLPDYFIDKANRQGLFNGRIVVVKSTGQGDASAFNEQDSLYTHCIRGVQNGQKVEENIINASISRVLNAANQWEQVLQCAHNPNLQVIISNTTEVGIQLVSESIHQRPPQSFPGKLLAFLYERFRVLGVGAHNRMVVVPTELVPDNGKKLEAIVLELAHLNGLERAFIEWLESEVHFCNSLVDRIVPGHPESGMQDALENSLGYSDGLLIMSEAYRLWAIEGNAQIKQILSFAGADSGVVIEPDIAVYRELKLRLLNGTHTLSCGLAFLSGCETVQQAMEDEVMAPFIAMLMQQEILPFIPYSIDEGVAQPFAAAVRDRFRNPHIRHQWLNISMQYSSKIKLRCVPVLLRHYQCGSAVPELLALGLAAYLLFMKVSVKRGAQYYGEYNGSSYLIQDEQAEVFYKRWMGLSTTALVQQTLADQAFWGEDLSMLPGLAQTLTNLLNSMIANGVKETVVGVLSKNRLLHDANSVESASR